MKYYTTENKLTNGGAFTARVVTDKTYTEDDLVDKILSKRNIVSRPDLRGVISALKESIVEIVREGSSLNLSWLKMGYSMKGNFDAGNAVRDPDRNPLEIYMNAGAALDSVLTEVKLERITHPDFSPRILYFNDGTSGTKNSQLTPGGIFDIIGERLRIGGPQPDNVGVFLSAEDGSETKIQVLLRNDPAYLSGQLPEVLAAGNYKVVVKTQLSSGDHRLTEVRIGSSNFSLTVA